MTLTGSGMLLTLRHYIGFLSYAVDVLRYVALNVVNLRWLVVIHWSFQWVWSWERKIRHEDHRLASQGLDFSIPSSHE